MPALAKSPEHTRPVNLSALENDVLPYVFKPGRYLGLEQGAYRKPFEKADVAMAAAFPDLYEIGISNYGLKLLYNLVNQHPKYMCDRVYAPALDFKAKMAEHNLPIYGVESKVPITGFDLLAFSLQYELNYTTIFGLLEAGQIPFRSEDRTSLEYPLLIAGGPGAGNPMPLAPFFDAFIIGDGEEVLIEILDIIAECKKEAKDRLDKPGLLRRLGELEGVYIPGVTTKAYKRIVDIAENPVELAPLIPAVEAVHDRVVVEARRGCDRMCRFCQPCFINLPAREQSIEKITESALKGLEETGYEECSLLSLSIADYSYFKDLVLNVTDALKEKQASLSLSSQRADRFSLEVAEAVQSVRKSTLTFAPEAGTMRLRDVVNKNLTDAEIMNAVTTAYKAGWNKVKLYFMIGLPTETNADLDGIVDIVKRIKSTCEEIRRDPELSIKHHMDVNLTISNFVPKPHTPFQWFAQETMPNLREKINYLRDHFRGMRGVKLNFTDPEISKLEAVISRGGPELADVIESAYRKGAYLDAWDDIKNFGKWFEALAELGLDPESYTRDRLCGLEDELPWDPIEMGLTKSWLQEEYRRSTEAASTTPCFETCSTCGVCATYSTWPKFIETPKKKPVLKVTTKTLTSESPPEVKDTRMATTKVRLKIEKRGQLRFISHLDWLRMIHRAVVRSKIPVAYSQGFNPKPKVAFSPAMPMFSESLGEYVDVELTRPMDGIREALNKYLPVNGQVLEERAVALHTPSIDKSIQTLNYSARWTCNEGGEGYTIKERIKFLADQTTLPVEIKPKKTSKKPNSQTAIKVFDLTTSLTDLNATHEQVDFKFKVQKGTAGNPVIPKPAWLLELINPNLQWVVTRTAIELNETPPEKEKPEKN